MIQTTAIADTVPLATTRSITGDRREPNAIAYASVLGEWVLVAATRGGAKLTGETQSQAKD